MKIKLMRWTTREKELVALAAFELIKGGICRSWSAALKMAQKEVLPPDRQRAPAGLTQSVAELRKLAGEVQARLEREKAAADREAAKSIVKDVISDSVGSGPTAQELNGFGAPKGQDFIASFVDFLGSQFRFQLTDRLVNETNEAFNRVEAEFKRRVAQIASKTHPLNNSRPRVVVVGLESKTRIHIENEFEEVLDIRFIEACENSNRISRLKDSTDVFIMMTSLIGHKFTNTVKGWKNVVNCPGYQGELKDILLEIAMK